jgi:hypothetical protein
MNKSILECTRKDLLSLPERDWNIQSTYDSLLIMNSRKKHESGWAKIIVVGVNDSIPIEIITQSSDDIMIMFDKEKLFLDSSIHFDCCPKSGAFHLWRRDKSFEVDWSLSSLKITLV